MGMGGADIASTAMGGAGALMNLFTGIKQLVDGKKIQKKLDAQGRPVYHIPNAFLEGEGIVRSQFNDPRLKGQTIMEDAAAARTAGQINNIQETAGSGSQALAALSNANNTLEGTLNNISLTASQQKYRDAAAMYNTLKDKAGYQDQQWSYNVRQPYDSASAKAQALHQAGMQNLSTAFKDGSNIALAASDAKTNSDNAEKFGQGYLDLMKAGLLGIPKTSTSKRK